MTFRKGYYEEYKAKKELSDSFGKQNVLKLAVSEYCDFIVLKPNSNVIEKIVEIKRNYNRSLRRNKKQYERLKALAIEHKIPLEIWDYKPNKGKTVEIVDGHLKNNN